MTPNDVRMTLNLKPGDGVEAACAALINWIKNDRRSTLSYQVEVVKGLMTALPSFATESPPQGQLSNAETQARRLMDRAERRIVERRRA